MSDKPSQRPGERLFSVVLVVFSLAALWQAYTISGFSGLSTPGIFPMLAAATMVLSALVILRRAFAQPSSGEPAAKTVSRFFREIVPPRHVTVVLLIAAYLAVMPWLGFLAASAVFLFVTTKLLWRRSLVTTLILTAGTTAAIYVVFRVVFQVVLPQGTLLRGLF